MRQVLRPRVALLFVSFGITTVACNPFADDSELDPMSLEPVSGEGVVSIERDGEIFRATEGATIEPGDRIEASRSPALIRLAGGRRITLAAESSVLISGDDSLKDPSGSLLAETTEPLSATFDDDVKARSDSGLFRFDILEGSWTAATYRGVVRVKEPGDAAVRVPSLYQASVAAGEVSPAVPHFVSDNDPWDELYLDEVIELNQRLERFSDAISAEFENGTLGLDYFRQLIPDTDVSFMRGYAARDASDLLIAFTIAEQDPERPLAEAFRMAFELHNSADQWGVVAGIMNVDPGALVAGLQGLVDTTDLMDRGISATERGPKAPGEQTGDVTQGPCTTIVDCILQSSGGIH
jgi:hypothetical protein